VKKVLIPVDNEKDLVEIPDNIKGNLDIRPVKWIDQVLEHALVRQPVPLPAAATGGKAGAAVKADPAGKRVRRGRRGPRTERAH
jgi:ATP-dependent Lon protease